MSHIGGALGGSAGPMGGMGGMGNAVSQYWKTHIADSVTLRIFVYFLAGLSLLFHSLVILDCVPGAPGSGSGTSRYYLLQLDAHNANYTRVTRLRIGYTAMCCSMNSGPEHCAITLGQNEQTSLQYLSTGMNDPNSFAQLSDNGKLPQPLYDVGASLQSNVFVVMPAIPGVFLALGVLMLTLYGVLNRPWVGPASSWRQSRRNRILDIMRVFLMSLIGLSIVFSFAVAVSDTQLFAAVKYVTDHNAVDTDVFQVTRGTNALALQWLAVITTIGFFVGIIQTHIEISAIKIKVTPDDTAGTTGGRQFTAVGDTVERASLLRDAEPMAMNPAGVQPQVPDGGQGGGMGGAGGRGGPMGMRGRGGPMGMRGGPMGARGGPMARGRGRGF